MVRVVDDQTFEAEIRRAERAVVDFFAPWCGPCVLFAPRYRRIARDYPHVSFFKLDAERAPIARRSVRVDRLPFFGLYERGELVDGLSVTDEEAFRRALEARFGSVPS